MKSDSPITEFTKNLADNDEVILIKRSDISAAPNGKDFILKGGAVVSDILRKEDFDDGADDGGYGDNGDEDQDVGPAQPAIDFGGHAQNSLALHDDLHKMMGDEGCQCQRAEDAPPYLGAAQDQQQPDEGGEGGAEVPDNMGKGKGVAPKPEGVSKEDFATLAKAVDALTELVKTNLTGGGVAPRKDDDGTQAGSPVVKGAGLATDTLGKGEQQQPSVDEKLAPLFKERDDLIAKRKAKIQLTPQEQVRVEALMSEIDNLEMRKNLDIKRAMGF